MTRGICLARTVKDSVGSKTKLTECENLSERGPIIMMNNRAHSRRPVCIGIPRSVWLVLSLLLSLILPAAGGNQQDGVGAKPQLGSSTSNTGSTTGSTEQKPDPVETKQQLQDYTTTRDPGRLNDLVPALIQMANSPQGQRALNDIFKGLREQWKNSGGQGNPDEFFAREMVNRAPEDPNAYRMLAQAQAGSRDLEGTIDSATKALDYGGPDPRMLTLRGGAYEKLGDFQAANQDARAALELNPRDASALALYKLTEGNALPRPMPAQPGQQQEPPAPGKAWDPAAVAREAARQGGGRDPALLSAALAKEAAAALSLGDAMSALRRAGQALEQNPLNAQAYNLKAMAEVRLAQNKAAEQDASKGLELAPGNSALLTTRAWAFGRQGNFKSALDDASAALRDNPTDGAAHFARAFALSGLGYREEMLRALQTASTLQPAFRSVYDQAVQLPGSADTMLLFASLDPGRDAAQKAPPKKKRSALLIILATLVGGFLIALGLLQNMSVREWTKRLARRTPAEEPSGSAFWGKFSQVRELGAGGMGVVYEAVDRGLGRRVAVKKMRDEIRSDERERRRFIEEARIVAALKHPNVVEIYAIEEEGRDLYLVFELVEGSTLEEKLRREGRFKPAEAQRVFQGVCSALEAAHARGIIHRDLKPANIILAPDGTAKVMDFGLARSPESSRMTTNTLWGSPSYMAPEQEEGRASPQSDLFSLGVCLYEALTGKLPFEGTPSAAFAKKKAGEYAPPSRHVPGIPLGFDRLAARALAPIPEKRFASAKAFAEALAKAL